MSNIIEIDVPTKKMLTSINKNKRIYDENAIPRGKQETPIPVLCEDCGVEIDLNKIAGFVMNVLDDKAEVHLINNEKGQMLKNLCLIPEYMCLIPMGFGKLENERVKDYQFVYFRTMTKHLSAYNW